MIVEVSVSNLSFVSKLVERVAVKQLTDYIWKPTYLFVATTTSYRFLRPHWFPVRQRVIFKRAVLVSNRRTPVLPGRPVCSGCVRLYVYMIWCPSVTEYCSSVIACLVYSYLINKCSLYNVRKHILSLCCCGFC